MYEDLKLDQNAMLMEESQSILYREVLFRAQNIGEIVIILGGLDPYAEIQ